MERPRDEWDRLVAPAAGSANQAEYVDQRTAGGSCSVILFGVSEFRGLGVTGFGVQGL